jgi:glycosyltransferase involved in cell wall biosynthesis
LIFTGPIAHAWMPSLLQTANVLVMASLNEGFGLVTLEALSAGTPIVVSKIKPFTEYLSDEDCTWADPLSVSSIEQAMREAIESFNPEKIQQSAEKLSHIYNWDRSASQHQIIYQTLLHPQESICQ